MPTPDEHLPTLGFDVAELFGASQETVHARLKAVSAYTPGNDESTVEEAYYFGHVGVHVTYQDHLVAEIMIRGRHAGEDICARDLRAWAGLGDASRLQGPKSSTWQLVDVDDREVFAHCSQLPLWRPDFAKLLATQEETFNEFLGESFIRHSWLGYENRTSRVDMHARFSRADGRLNRLAVNLPLGVDVLSREHEILEWAGIANAREPIVAGGLEYNITLLPHGIQLRAFTTPWSCPLPKAATIPTGRSRTNKVKLSEAVALAEAKLKDRFSPPIGLDVVVVDPERIEETEEGYLFQSIFKSEQEQQEWLPQTYDPSVGLDGPGFTSHGGPLLPAVRVSKATGSCRWSSVGDALKCRFEAWRNRVVSVFRP